MDDVKNQFKGLAKKLNNPFASKFKGESHKLGDSQQKQPPSQQAEWKKLQQERWERERSPHPTPHQDRSQPPAASSAQSNVPNSVLSSAHTIGSLPTTSKRSTESLDDGCTAVKVDNSGISDATHLQKGDGFGALDAVNLNKQVHKDDLKPYVDHEGILSSSEFVGMPSDNFDKQVHKDDLKPHANLEGMSSSEFVGMPPDNSSSSKVVGVPSDNAKVHGIQNESTHGFDPFSSRIGSLSTGTNMSSLQMYECPVCGSWWKSETEVQAHVDECLSQSTCKSLNNRSQTGTKSGDDQVKVSLGVFLSGGPSNETLDVLLRILCNIVSSPHSEKYRRIRLSNPKIHDTVGMALGGVELLETVGFTYENQEEEVWAVMDPPPVDQIDAMKWVISQLETCPRGTLREEANSKEKAPSRRKVDRQVRVFYAAPENQAAKMELPDSFFQLSASELKQEAAARKKKLDDSQLLVSRASRERMAAANKRKYKATIIRIQFPDGVVLQGMFLPWEPTSALYEFVSNSLRDPSTQFTLVAPGLSRKQVIPAFEEGSTKITTLEEENLVPAVLIKFQCAESDSLTFTGLHPDILVGIEPLSSTTLPS